MRVIIYDTQPVRLPSYSYPTIPMTMTLKGPLVVSTLAATFLFSNCGPKNKFTPPPPPTVTVTLPIQRDQVVYETFPASLDGISEVQIRARVKGELENIYFNEGKIIKQGERLFEIESDIYEANVASAQADVIRSKAELRLATANLARLVKAGSRAVSELDLERARADVDNSQASVMQSEAKLQSAQIDLSYTNIYSPITGRTSRSRVDIGNLVGNGEPTLLTTVVDESSIRVYYDVPERIMLDFYRIRSEDKKIRDHLSKVNLELADGTLYEHLGTIDYIDNKLNENSRTAQVRAIFPNPKGRLSAGLFAEVGYPQTFKDALMIPTASILKDIAGNYVWVVTAENKVERRGVITGASVEIQSNQENSVPTRESIILKGLAATDQVIVRGLQRVREGATVTTEALTTATANQSK